MISTVNVNFLIKSATDPAFRRSVLQSELCTADGMPVVWLAKMLGIPVKERLAGSDMFQAFRENRDAPLSVFIFGGQEGVADRLCNQLTAENGGLRCAGWHYPGFGSIDEMSTKANIAKINDSGAQFLAVALGAAKGQAWLVENRDRIQIPVRVHLGASINFEAGILKRAPLLWRNMGLEWLWRIKEEPHLWRRYFGDGIALGRLLISQFLPLLLLQSLEKRHSDADVPPLQVTQTDTSDRLFVSLSGAATRAHVHAAIEQFEVALECHKNVTINLADTARLDDRFLGLLLMLNKVLTERALCLNLDAVPAAIARRLRLNGFGFLLDQHWQKDACKS
jgi:N-acetylglucosaminyldiphosphoundecaprenol N-acetyl-beta-D-mannosaminyltransferase